MAFDIPKINYSGKIREITLGTGVKSVTVGGATSYPFHLFEGTMPHPPRIAMDVFDHRPEEWPEAAVEPFADVLDDPAAWAKKNVAEYGADMIALQLTSIDPNGMNRAAREAADIAKKVIAAVEVPVILWGVSNHEKDTEVLRILAEECDGKNLSMGPVEEGDYKQIGAGALAYKHVAVASSPIDVNLAKQLNILLGNLGVPADKILVDPTTGALGYGLEYTYSVMERDRMAALTQEDEKLQYPLVCNVGIEVWKTKEAKTAEADDPKLGNAKERGILMECVTATSLLLAGADILILRHPESVKQMKKMIQSLMG
ncbi:MAG: acetyl-CoA decarbonylase/synthase complex subunit delta [Spirochaetes bacterium]|nr:acetyl-CoA decarbonylase/synthase complex subunit delta [Spirochaetota bacterium]